MTVKNNSGLIHRLISGDCDIVGDIHGEIEALDELITKLRYDKSGQHLDDRNRKLVFVGDLVDRGPDSPAVVERVRSLVENDQAQCVLGNHDLNILLAAKGLKSWKPSQGWFTGEKSEGDAQPVEKPCSSDAERDRIVEFFGSLPLGVEGDGIRITHACWHVKSIEEVRSEKDVLAVYRAYRDRINAELKSPDEARLNRRENEVREYRDKLKKADEPPMDDDELFDLYGSFCRQLENPVKHITSGPEQFTPTKFFAGGRWRWTERVRWWEKYDDVPCVCGHYSERWIAKAAYCTDWGVAHRCKERQQEKDKAHSWIGLLATFRRSARSGVFDVVTV